MFVNVCMLRVLETDHSSLLWLTEWRVKGSDRENLSLKCSWMFLCDPGVPVGVLEWLVGNIVASWMFWGLTRMVIKCELMWQLSGHQKPHVSNNWSPSGLSRLSNCLGVCLACGWLHGDIATSLWERNLSVDQRTSVGDDANSHGRSLAMFLGKLCSDLAILRFSHSSVNGT